MSTDAGAQLAGLLFGCVVASLGFWLGCVALPFARPVAAWFQQRMEAAKTLTFLGSKQAAKNMSPGQVVVASIAAIAISAIILVNAGSRIGATSSAAVPLSIFMGCSAVVGGGFIIIRAAKRSGGDGRAGLIAGATLSLVGSALAVAAVVWGFSAAS